jgi:hypothetical protein
MTGRIDGKKFILLSPFETRITFPGKGTALGVGEGVRVEGICVGDGVKGSGCLPGIPAVQPVIARNNKRTPAGTVLNKVRFM